MKHISIRELQKMSERSILALPGATRIQSGDRAIGLLIPFKKPDPEKVKRFLTSVAAARAAALKAGADEAAEDRALAKYGPVEPLDPPEPVITAKRSIKRPRKKRASA
jgi:hypothetical protein